MSKEINEEIEVKEETVEVEEVKKDSTKKAKLKKALKIAGGVGIIILAGVIGLVAIGGSEKSGDGLLDDTEPEKLPESDDSTNEETE